MVDTFVVTWGNDIEYTNLGTGMRAIHTVKEWLDVKDMYSSAEMTLEIMRLNGETALAAAGK